MFVFMFRSDSSGDVEAVQTSKNILYSKKAIIVSAGCWTGCLMQDLFRNWGAEFHVPIRPRKVCLDIAHSLIPSMLVFLLSFLLYSSIS